jgi:hypothetical protein
VRYFNNTPSSQTDMVLSTQRLFLNTDFESSSIYDFRYYKTFSSKAAIAQIAARFQLAFSWNKAAPLQATKALEGRERRH